MKSPGALIEVRLNLADDGVLSYGVNRGSSVVIAPSPMGVILDAGDFSKLDKVKALNPKKEGLYNAQDFVLAAGEQNLTLSFKVSDDGAAFRYSGDGQRVLSEATAWTLPAQSKIWFFERKSKWKLKSYAGYWTHADIDKMPGISPKGPIQGNPLVVDLQEGGYALLSEAALINHSGLRFKAIGDRRFAADFTEGANGFDVGGEYLSPWRVILAVDHLDDLVNQTMITDLSPSPDSKIYTDTSWITPGKSVWRWWCCRLGTPDQEARFIDMAAELGFEYSLIDDGWKDWDAPWETITGLANRAKSKGVEIWVWQDSKDVKDPANDWAQMKDWLGKVQAAGIVGVKVDFMNSEDKATIDFMTTFLHEAAKRKIMVNWHGSNAAHGEEKTFPNEMTREGIRGLELNYLKEGPLTADHNAALPFTRFAVGHADYTPLGFTDPGATTWAQQLATLVTTTSRLQVISEDPEYLLAEPRMKPILPLLKDMPTVWDETRVIGDSAIGELAILARRKGVKWYVGVINGGEARSINLDLSFLKSGQAYTIFSVTDDIAGGPIEIMGLKDPRPTGYEKMTILPFKVETSPADLKSELRLNLAKGGGAVFVFTPRASK